MTDSSQTAFAELRFGIVFESLYTAEGLARLDAVYLDWLEQCNPGMAARLRAARRSPPARSPEESEFLIDIAATLDAFVSALFTIETDVAALATRHADVDPLLRVKWKFVKRQAVLGADPVEVAAYAPEQDRAALRAAHADPDDPYAFSVAVLGWQETVRRGAAAERVNAAALLESARRYAAWAAMTDAGQRRHRGQVIFDLPRPVEPESLLGDAVTVANSHAGARAPKVFRIRPADARSRDGFDLTDPGPTLENALDQAKYCLLCHRQANDTCSRGMRKDAGSNPFRRSALGVALHGCPLDQRISEFLSLKLDGNAIGALAMIVLDNPMVAATGHRICNDCSKSCVFQLQTPVDIPAAETRALRDVLELPWGFEVYGLLTRWNPLNFVRPVPKPASGASALVVGMGPAGFTLAHHLLNEGHGVVGVDGLKIEPLADPTGRGTIDTRARTPIRDISALGVALGERIAGGFGGVAEYGITARWDKNLLTVVRLLLERRPGFALYGGVRFGGTLGFERAWSLGFDHVALATGAGRPTTIPMPGGLVAGVRMASDFLMAVQLTGAARRDSLASLQLRLPVIVIGGGLTAVDAATESLAYYVAQVETFLDRHEALVAADGERAARAGWPQQSVDLAEEFIAHARMIRAERAAARAQRRAPDLLHLLRQWGGVTIAYRRTLNESPAYRLNHEELGHALAEGVDFAECLTPRRVLTDATGHARAVRFAKTGPAIGAPTADRGTSIDLPARTVLVAVGTHPNTVLADEAPEFLQLDGDFFRALVTDGSQARLAPDNPKPDEPAVILHCDGEGRSISYFGDLHPAFSGNVVKAMASAKRGYPIVSAQLNARAARRAAPGGGAFATMRRILDDRLHARVEQVERLGPGIVEVVVRAPEAASSFAPGQFFRLQDFETLAPRSDFGGLATRLATEGLAMTGAWVDRQRGLVSLIVLETGASTDLCAHLRVGEPVVLMGPTGAPTEIASGENVVLVGGGLGNAVLFSIGAAFRAAGSRVLYFAGYRRISDRFKSEQIEHAADVVVWCCDESPGLAPARAHDGAHVGSVVDAVRAFASGDTHWGTDREMFEPNSIDRIITIGSDAMMAALAALLGGELRDRFRRGARLIASVNSPMQCMMKEICAQCLQRHQDPDTGAESYVFSCRNQDQALLSVDFACLRGRLGQNALPEAQGRGWLQHCLALDNVGREQH